MGGDGLDCAHPQTQTGLTFCAGQELDFADAALNAAYARAVEVARARDAEGQFGSAVPITDLLRDAQRAWLPFRDTACDLESTAWGGGTGQSMAYLMCKTRLTKRRTEDLKLFTDFPN